VTLRRALILAAAAAALLLAAAAPARAERGLLVGVADDRLKWQSRSWATVTVLRDLGADAVRITVSWEPGRRTSRYDWDGLRRTVTAANGMRVVVSVFGRAKDAPADEASRREYCGYVGSLLQRFPTVNDVVIWALPLGWLFGRIGCFAAGCCFGRAAPVSVGVRFPAGSVAHEALREAGTVGGAEALTPALHATQLYEAAGLALLGGAVLWVRRRQRRHGEVLLAYLAGYAVLRTVVEVFRGERSSLTLTLDLNNLLDMHYREAYSQQQIEAPGRGVVVGAMVKF